MIDPPPMTVEDRRDRLARVFLRPLQPSDYDVVFRAETASLDRLVRFRNRGMLAPPEQFTASLWTNVLVNLVTCSAETGEPLALFTCYSENFQHGTAKIAALRLDRHTRISGLEGVDLFLDYLFDVFPFRKLYLDVLEWNAPQFASMARFGARLEARLEGHELHGTRPVDLLVYAIDRQAWGDHRDRQVATTGSEEPQSIEAFRHAVGRALDLAPEDAAFASPTFFDDLDSLERIVVLDLVEDGASREVPEEMILSWRDLADVWHAYLTARDR